MQRKREELWDAPSAATPARRGRRTRTEGQPVMAHAEEGEHHPPAPEFARTERQLPRPFSFHWGGGQIVEEAFTVAQWNEPTVQLLQYDNGGFTVRFCSYNHAGMFQRGPLMVDENELASLKEALNKTPRLRALLKKMVE